MSCESFSEVFSHTGTINRLGTVLIRDNSDYIILDGFTSAGSCPNSNGLVIVRIPATTSGIRSFSIALAAKVSGESVMLSVDDAFKHPEEGSCFLRSLQIES